MICTEICEICYIPDFDSHMFYGLVPDSKMCYTTKVTDSIKLVSAHNCFIQIMLVIRWSSSLIMRCQDSIT